MFSCEGYERVGDKSCSQFCTIAQIYDKGGEISEPDFHEDASTGEED